MILVVTRFRLRSGDLGSRKTSGASATHPTSTRRYPTACNGMVGCQNRVAYFSVVWNKSRVASMASYRLTHWEHWSISFRPTPVCLFRTPTTCLVAVYVVLRFQSDPTSLWRPSVWTLEAPHSYPSPFIFVHRNQYSFVYLYPHSPSR